MRKVLVTGSKGFIGKNLMEALSRQKDLEVSGFDVDDDPAAMRSALLEAEIVYHLAGVNRPEQTEEYARGNAGSLKAVLSILQAQNRHPVIVLSSSTQAELNNPYGVSKKMAEDLLAEYGRRTGASIYVFRLANVFGKWCRPNYNSVVATFCHNIANGLDIFISDRAHNVELLYIDDVVAAFLDILKHRGSAAPQAWLAVEPSYKITLGDLADKIYQFRDIRNSLVIPDLSDNLTRYLYATYLSYLDKDDFAYALEQRSDPRGSLVEFIKSRYFGQIFVSKTPAGVIRGNHYHDTKTEKFCVIQGKAVIRLRHLLSDEVLVYPVSGDNIEVVDIPPGYTHSIENVSAGEMTVLFWTDQIFDPDKPDTYHCEV